METGSAIVRAMIKVMSYKDRVHTINMSYGERAHWANAGRIGELMNEVIDKYGVTWVTSAGNMGPALCTISKYRKLTSPFFKFTFTRRQMFGDSFESLKFGTIRSEFDFTKFWFFIFENFQTRLPILIPTVLLVLVRTFRPT